MWWYYGHDAYYEQILEHELGYSRRDDRGERRSAPETPIPLWWLSAWIGGLSIISIGLGLASHWLSP